VQRPPCSWIALLFGVWHCSIPLMGSVASLAMKRLATDYPMSDEAHCVFQRRQLDTRAAGRLDRPRHGALEIVRLCHMPALWASRADDLKHRSTFPRGLGSASEGLLRRLVCPGGALFVSICGGLCGGRADRISQGRD
jgi:hypothetical protein